MKIGVQSSADAPHLGYGTFGANLIKGLEELGVEVFEPRAYAGKTVPHTKTVLWATIPAHTTGRYRGQRSVLFTMWESSKLPEPMRATLHNFDLVCVPNEQNRELFSEYHPNVVKVPLGYDSNVWTYEPRSQPERVFRFLFCGAGAGVGPGNRKGSDAAIRAFTKAFPEWETMLPQPRLTVKCLRLPPEPRPFIDVVEARLSIDELRGLYLQSHAMVLPSRGEGWGYHPQQAVASGMPAILTDIPGHTEYSWVPGFAHVPVTPAKAGQFMHGDAGDWWEPDVDSIAAHMRDVYEHYDEWREAAWAGGQLLRDRYTHLHMAQDVVDRIGVDDLTSVKPGPWEPFRERLYPLEVTRHLGKQDCTIAETSYEFDPGSRYWVSCHVRQVILEAGYSANADENHPGLLPEEVPAGV